MKRNEDIKSTIASKAIKDPKTTSIRNVLDQDYAKFNLAQRNITYNGVVREADGDVIFKKNGRVVAALSRRSRVLSIF